LGYGNVYYRRREEALSGKQSDIPGIAQTKETKLILLGDYRSSLEKGECINYSKPAMQETLEYVFAPDGGVEHSKGCSRLDPSGAKSNHGDMVMADSMAWRGIRERSRIKPSEEKPEIKPGCLAWRNQMRDVQKRLNERDGW
jgi:hypothetical protein